MGTELINLEINDKKDPITFGLTCEKVVKGEKHYHKFVVCRTLPFRLKTIGHMGSSVQTSHVHAEVGYY
jgi:hypothetical protein